MLVTAVSESFAALKGPVARRGTVRTEAVDGLVVTHVCVGDAVIAVLPRVRRFGGRGPGEEKESAESERGERGLAENRTKRKSLKFHKSLQERIRAGGWICVLRIQTLVW